MTCGIQKARRSILCVSSGVRRHGTSVRQSVSFPLGYDRYTSILGADTAPRVIWYSCLGSTMSSVTWLRL
jgi:hypothetical protein